MDWLRAVVPCPVWHCRDGDTRDWGHRWGWGLLPLLLLLTVGAAQAEVRVTEVSFAARSDGQGYVMRLHATDRPEAHLLKTVDEHTLTWVIYGAVRHDDFETQSPEGPVKRYTTTQRSGRLVLSVHLKERYSVSVSAYRDGASADLLLNLAYDGDIPVSDAGSPEPSSEQSATGTSASAEPSEAETEAPTSSSAPGLASDGSGLAARMTRQRSRLDTIVIDPGHGGRDPGAVANGLQEKNIVLDVAHQLGDYIENRLDIEVAYTRTDDRFIPLEERGHFANRVGGDLFVSLHVNAYQSSAVDGTETYFLGRSKTDAARRVMRQENSVVREYEENPERYDEYDAEAFVKGELFLSASMRFSEEFASIIQNQFKNRVHRESRGVRQAGFYVLWSASMPSVLVELGYLTNPQEARFLNSDRGQTYLASAIFRAVRKYKNQYNKGLASSE